MSGTGSDAATAGRAVVTGRGRRRLHGGHPWVYADDVRTVDAEPGGLVRVQAPDGRALGWALYSSGSRIALRLVTRADERPGPELWRARARAAVAHRRDLGLLAPGDACRLIGGDSEGFPGLVVDRYADVLVLQSGCQGSDRLRDAWLASLEDALRELAPEVAVRAVLDRSDSATRAHEELEKRVAWLRGEGGDPVEVCEAERPDAPALRYAVDPESGHKTGHYLDQRENRALAARHAAGRRVLDAFSYDGLFGVRAALAGAREVVCVDQSSDALERALRNAALNGVADRVTAERANAMHDLRARVEAGERYGLVVVDPPAFARGRREVEGALRGYRELNRRALALLEPGGVLVTASCSFNVARGAFLDVLAAASLDAGREARIFRQTGAGPDHPVLPTLPESEYLKCVFARVS